MTQEILLGRKPGMPNAADKNFVRPCAAINGFRARYRAWPTFVRIRPKALDDPRDLILTPEDFSKVEQEVRLLAEVGFLIAEDETGRRYDYDNDSLRLPSRLLSRVSRNLGRLTPSASVCSTREAAPFPRAKRGSGGRDSNRALPRRSARGREGSSSSDLPRTARIARALRVASGLVAT